MEEKTWMELLELNAETSWNCDFDCEDCYRFFDCPSPLKWGLYGGGRMEAIRRNMQKIGHKVVVSSGKGGVGKSTVTACLAVTLAGFGLRVGVVDCDFAGPSIPKILGMPLQRLKLGRDGIIPAEGPLGLKVVSTAFLLGGDGFVTWFHRLKREAIENFLGHTDFGELDYLLVDLPPGTGSETHNLLKFLPDVSGGIVVTVPSDLSQEVARRGITLLRKAGVRLLGIVENMSGIACPDCGEIYAPLGTGGGERLAAEAGVPLLGKVVMDESLAAALARGEPPLLNALGSPAALSFAAIACRLRDAVEFSDSQGRVARSGKESPGAQVLKVSLQQWRSGC